MNDLKQGSFQHGVTYRSNACVYNVVHKSGHCFKCGGTGHQGRYCKKTKSGKQGN